MFSKNSLFLFIVIISSLLLNLSCGESKTENVQNKPPTEVELKTGAIVPSIQCKSNPAHSYVYYLPTSYNPSKKYPVVIAFDAHARGRLAVSRFQEAADLYGYVVAGSNNAKNGLQDINPVINSIMDDVLNRFSVDQKRIYTAGFSGGARIAASVAIYKGGIKGVLAFGGGMPKVGQELKSKFDFLGVAGLNDFNYQEMKTLEKALNENGFTSRLMTFEGGHEWPNKEVLKNALQWLSIMAMKQEVIEKDDNLIRGFLMQQADTINKLINTGDNYQAYQLYTSFLNDLEGFLDVSEYQEQYKQFLASSEIKQGQKDEEKEKQSELDQQELMLGYFKANSFAEIEKKIVELQKSPHHVSKRVLGFIGMLCYIYTESAVNSQDKKAYEGFLKVYGLVEPKNPDKEYFKACQAIMDDKQDLAMQYLQKAIDYGYSDVDKLKVVGYFEKLRTLPEFDLLIQKAMKNSQK